MFPRRLGLVDREDPGEAGPVPQQLRQQDLTARRTSVLETEVMRTPAEDGWGPRGEGPPLSPSPHHHYVATLGAVWDHVTRLRSCDLEVCRLKLGGWGGLLSNREDFLLKGRHQLPHKYQRVLNKTIYCIYSFIFFSTVTLHFSKLCSVAVCVLCGSSRLGLQSRSSCFYSEIMWLAGIKCVSVCQCGC